MKRSLTGSLRNDVFGERFKYAICSSGILEKDYIPGLGALSSVGQASKPHIASGKVATMVKPSQTIARRLSLSRVKRWDLGVAGLALVCGVYQLGGTTWLLAFMCSAAAVGGAGVAYLTSNVSTSLSRHFDI